VLYAEFSAIRRRDPDFDAGELTIFTVPLLIRAVGVLTIGVVPLLVVRSSDDTDSLVVPLIGSLALDDLHGGTGLADFDRHIRAGGDPVSHRSRRVVPAGGPHRHGLVSEDQ